MKKYIKGIWRSGANFSGHRKAVADRIVPKLFMKTDNGWKEARAWVKINDEWRPARFYIKIAGRWLSEKG